MKRVFLFLSFLLYNSFNSTLLATPTEDLLDAALKGDLKKAEEAIKAGADVNGRTKEEVRSPNYEKNYQLYSEGSTPLIISSGEGYLEIIKLLLANKADVNAKVECNDCREKGKTALIYASKIGRLEIAKLLIENKADVNAKDNKGRTALWSASGRDHLDVAKLLIENKADVNAKDNDGKTALLVALEIRYLEVAKLLIENKADVNAKDNDGKTTLMYASRNGHLEVAKLLIENKADVNAKGNNGWTALMGASQKGHLEIAKLLIEYKADVNAKDNNGWTALIGASQNGHLEIVKLLIEYKAHINSKTNDGWTALMGASQNGHLEIVKLLLELKAELNLKDNRGKNAFIYSLEKKHFPVLKYLVSQKTLPLNFAIEEEYIFFFQIWNQSYQFLEGERKEVLEFMKNKYVNLDKEMDSEEGKPCIASILWFLSNMDSSSKEDFDFESVDKNINFPGFLQEIVKPGFVFSSLNPEIYYFISLYYVKLENFGKADEYMRLACGSNSSYLGKAKKSEPFQYYFYSSEFLRKGLPFSLEFNKKIPKLLVQNGHTSQVNSITFSLDGTKLATASNDKTAKIWDLEGKLLADLKGHTSPVNSITFSPDETRIATASQDNTAKIWDLEGKLLADLKGHTNSVYSITFSPDGTKLATASNDKTAKIWDLEGKLLADLKGHTSDVSRITFSPDGTKIATASSDNIAKIWDWEGKLLADLKGHTDSVKSLTFSPDGTKIATASSDNTAKIWDWEGKLLADLKGHTDSVNSITFSLDGTKIATASDDSTAKIWDLEGKLLADLKRHTDRVDSISFSPDGTKITTVSDNTAKIWDLKGKLLSEIKDRINSITFSPDGTKIAIASRDAYILNLEGKLLAYLISHSESIKSITFSPDGTKIATASAKIWDLEGKLLADLKEHTNRVNSIIFSPDGTKIATASWDQKAKVWDLEGKLLADLEGHTSDVSSITFSPDGTKIATASYNTAKIWDVSNVRASHDLPLPIDLKGHTDSVNSISFTPDGTKLATASYDDTAKIWDLEGKLLADLKGHTGSVDSISFSPDGTKLATASSDKTAKIWDLKGKLLADLKGHTSDVNSITFSPDGKYLATGSRDNTIILWKPGLEKEPKPWKVLEGHSGSISYLKFIREGKLLVSGSTDDTIKFWNISANKKETRLLLTQQLFNNGNGLVFTPDGRYDYTSDSIKDFVSFKVAGQFIELDDIDDYYRINGLREKVLSGELKPMDEKHIARMAEKLPAITIITPTTDSRTKKAESMFRVRIKSEVNKISRLEAVVNGFTAYKKEITEDMVKEGNRVDLKFPLTLKQGNNHVKLLAYNEFNLPSYATIEVTREVTGKMEKSNLHVLSIGVNVYSKNSFKNLKFSVPDAESMVKAMESQKGNSLYKDVKTTLLTSNQKDLSKKPTRKNILNELNNLEKNAGPDDVVVIYYSGHGMSAPYKASNLFYWVPEDFDWSRNTESSEVAKSEGIDAETLTEILGRMKAHKVVLLIDACHSGDVLLAARGDKDKREEADSGLKRLANGTGRFIFASSAGDEKSRETEKLGHGLFTYVLLNALGASNTAKQQIAKKKSFISLSEINAYISVNFQEQVKKYMKSEVQTPIPMSGLGRYHSRSKTVDFPFFEVKK